MTVEEIRKNVISFVEKYNISKIELFGSRAEGINKEFSDIDLIIEFSGPVTLMKLSQLRIDLEECLELDVDIIHGPIRENDMIEVGRRVELYAA